MGYIRPQLKALHKLDSCVTHAGGDGPLTINHLNTQPVALRDISRGKILP